MKAMIFAAGLGTRLQPITNDRPKALVEVGGKTLLQWQIEKVRDAGIRDIYLNIHHFPDMILNYLQEHDYFDCHLMVSDEREELLDTGGGLKRVESVELRVESSSKVESLELKVESLECKGESILALNVDILSNIDLKALIAAYEKDGISRLVVSQRDTSRYLLFDESNRLVGWENISTGEIRGNDELINDELIRLAFSGMQILSPRVCARLINKEERVFSLIDFYLDICDKEILQAYVPEDYQMLDIGKLAVIRDGHAERFVQAMNLARSHKVH
ncbi:MAG: NTP transferase domain-containing protein [Paludibacteraceae bacterium]|nr:NTP transferase domain-containing protein [Paludibacteraceae bacterium]